MNTHAAKSPTDHTVLRLNPAIPYAWASDTALRFGLDNPVLVLENINRAEYDAIERLTSGCTMQTLHRNWWSITSLEAFIARLTPVLCQTNIPFTPPNQDDLPPKAVRLIAQGNWDFLRQKTGAIITTGLKEARITTSNRADLAVVFAQNLLDPGIVSYLLRDDLTVLPVVFTDSAVRIGPEFSNRGFSCVRCLVAAQAGRDADYPLIASQLMNQPAFTASPKLCRQIPGFIAKFTRAIYAGQRWSASQQWIIPTDINLHKLPTVLPVSQRKTCECHHSAIDMGLIPIAA